MSSPASAGPHPSNARATGSAAARPGTTADPQHRLVWTYPRFNVWDYVGSAAVTLVGLYLEFGIEGDFPDGSWDNGVLFDDTLRNALVAPTRRGRDHAAALSDYFWYGPQYYPLLIDGLFVPLATDRWNFDVAAQMSLINWQAMSLAATLTRLSHRTVGRARPSLQECAEDPDYNVDCEPGAEERTASFVSGHTSMAMTGAGLVCAHHQALPLYGNEVADTAACAVAVAAASTNGILRIMADQHWPTDVITGILIGLGAGYGLPRLLHYRSERPEPIGAEALPRNTVVLPLVSDQVLGVQWVGLF
jgi:membrane-associated phospholipid phosphatase